MTLKPSGVLASVAVPASALAFAAVAVAPMGLAEQAAFGFLTTLAVLSLGWKADRVRLLAMAFLSFALSLRYMAWRVTDTLDFEQWLPLLLGAGLIAAEAFGWGMVALTHWQTARPLERKPVPLPDDPRLWPTVDVFIPTYNEPLDVVHDAVLAALAMDWPRDRMRVWILDDGRRPEFKAFAAEAGVGYLTREGNAHAKAGNLNAALARTRGELVAVFDCDHVPTRAFLQATVGWFLREDRLAMVQTPHHFYSPDPFERNLELHGAVPNEGRMFYGNIQPGNDLWNAAFFCGSCAVLRRSALDAVGGFAVETVTEDAHTALRLHRAGFTTAYIKLPLAAGLATERLSRHVAQRMRWARGMAQIMRVDNPLFARGLTLAQRVCYLSAIGSFFSALPRLVMLTAPVVYLAFDVNVLKAGLIAVASYAVPHLLAVWITNSRLWGDARHSFWAEIYETTLATYLLGPTLLTLIDPKRGKFNVTDKGGKLDEAFFDRAVVRPHLVMAAILLVSAVVGTVRHVTDPAAAPDAYLVNMFWAAFNLAALSAAIASARERRQVRRHVRVDVAAPCAVRAPCGRLLLGETVNLSKGGAMLRIDPGAGSGRSAIDRFAKDAVVDVTIPCAPGEATFPARVVSAAYAPHDPCAEAACAGEGAGRHGHALDLRVAFAPRDLAEEMRLVRAVLGRADAWTGWDAAPRDAVLGSMYRILTVALGGSRFLAAFAAAAMLAALAFAVWVAWPSAAQAAERPATARGTATVRISEGRTETLSFRDLGAARPIRLDGLDAQASLPLSIRRDEVVADAGLRLVYSAGGPTPPGGGRVEVFVNGQPAGFAAVRWGVEEGEVELPLDPALLQDFNRIGFRLAAGDPDSCDDMSARASRLALLPESGLALAFRRLASPPDLAALPLPFFDRRDMRGLKLPFVLAGQGVGQGVDRVDGATLEAAAVTASWFGAQGAWRGASFPVSVGRLPAGNAVLFTVGDPRPAGIPAPAHAGPSVEIHVNPADPEGRILALRGRTPEELRAAAVALTVEASRLSGRARRLDAAPPAPRAEDDVPRLIPSDRPVRFTEISGPVEFKGLGRTARNHDLSFRTSADFFAWRGNGAVIDFAFRADDLADVDLAASRLAVTFNGRPVGSYRLDGPKRQRVLVPPYMVTGSNRLSFAFIVAAKPGAACRAPRAAAGLSIDGDSTIDLASMPHFAEMPDLGAFVNAGFPFTKFADLGRTAFVLPDSLSTHDVEAMLSFAGAFGDATGVAGTEVKVLRTSEAERAGPRDILAIGAAGTGDLLSRWRARAPVMAGDGAFRPTREGFGDRMLAAVGRGQGTEAARATGVGAAAGPDAAALVAFESPLAAGRSVVGLTAFRADRLPVAAEALRMPEAASRVRGDVALLRDVRVDSFRLGDRYGVGSLPPTVALMRALSDRPLGLAIAAASAALVLAWISQAALARRARERLKPAEPGPAAESDIH